MFHQNYSKFNIVQFIQTTYTILNNPNAKNIQSTKDSFKSYLMNTLPLKEESNEMFDILSNCIFQGENNKIIKEPFILFPIIFSTNPILSKDYLNKMFDIIKRTINDNYRSFFLFISQVFGQIINSLYNNSTPINKKLLSKEDEKNIYNTLLKFCINIITINKKDEQICGCLYLTELIENCPIAKEKENIKSLWETISLYIDNKSFQAKSEILNGLISLIVAGERNFKPFVTGALIKILDYLTDSDWMRRKLALNVLYILSFYFKEEIIPLKEHIIEFLNELKNDKITEVKEVCLQTLKLLQEDKENKEEKAKEEENCQIHNHHIKNDIMSRLGEFSKKEREKNEKKKNTFYYNETEGKGKKKNNHIGTKKKQKSSSVAIKDKNEKNLNQSSPLFKLKVKNPNKNNITPYVQNKEKVKENEKMINNNNDEKKEIFDIRPQTPIQTDIFNNDNDNQIENNKKSPQFHQIENEAETEKDINSKRSITPAHKLNSNFTENVKIRVIKANSLNSNIDTYSVQTKENKKNNLNLIKKEIKVNLIGVYKEKAQVKEEIKIQQEENNNTNQKVIYPLEREISFQAKPQNIINLVEQIKEQIKHLSQRQSEILSSLSSLSKTVESNYENLNKRLIKVEKKVKELTSQNEQRDLIHINKENDKIDQNLEKVLDAISKNNFILALNLSVVNDDYLFLTISKITSHQILTIDNNTIEDVLSRLIAIIPRGEHLDEMIKFCNFVVSKNIKIKPIIKQNLKDVIEYLFKNKNKFTITEETNKVIDKINLLLSANSTSNI